MAELLYPEESYAIVGACFEVHEDKQCGFLFISCVSWVE